MKIFLPFRLDTLNHCLWRDDERVSLTPKAFDVLRYLVEHTDRLVTQDEILEALWPGTYVNPEVIKKYVLGIRKVLGDQAENPTYIATFPKRGYQFIAQVRDEGAGLLSEPAASPIRIIVGREDALTQLDDCLSDAMNGQRQILFVTGEAGIGKTTLLDIFHQRAAFSANLRIARGQCVEGFGGKEAYYPVLEAIGQLIRDTEGTTVLQTLMKRAPTWLVQFSGLVKAEQREILQRETHGTTRERMVREICEALEAITADCPLVLILEDLHWVDPSTLDFISALARRRGPARLLLVATYRPAEVVVSQSPLKGLKQDLLLHHLCQEIVLERLEESDVAKYLDLEFPGAQFPSGLATLIYHQSSGNALFMTAIVRDLAKRRLVAQSDGQWQLMQPLKKIEPVVPETLQQMLEIQFDQLSEQQQSLLKCASVAGERFSIWGVASVLDIGPAEIEDLCEKMVEKQQFLNPSGIHELPNGEFSMCYEFKHSLYRQAIYRRLSDGYRSKVHRVLGESAEVLYGKNSWEFAAELATHFELGRVYKQAAKYLQQAASNAIRRFAYQEAVGLSRRGLELLEKVPDSTERADQELCLQLTLGVPLVVTKGYASPDVGNVYLRARELCKQLGDMPDISEVLWGLWTFYTLRGDLDTARGIAEEFLRLAERLPYPGLAMRGHWALEINFLHRGEFTQCLEHFEKAMQLCDPQKHVDDALFYALNPGVAMPGFAAMSLWFLGYPDQALARVGEALAMAQKLSEPHGIAHAHFFSAIIHQLRGETKRARQHAESSLVVAREHGLGLYQVMATVMQSWALSLQSPQEEWIEKIRQGIADHQATETVVLLPHFWALLAEALYSTNQAEEAFDVLDKALKVAHKGGERYYEAEMYRLKGEFLFKKATEPTISAKPKRQKTAAALNVMYKDAERCFTQAIQIAQKQKAKSFELQATISLARLYQRQKKLKEAHERLEHVYEWFTEGFDTADLRSARALLAEL